jgi:hypothetical protein
MSNGAPGFVTSKIFTKASQVETANKRRVISDENYKFYIFQESLQKIKLNLNFGYSIGGLQVYWEFIC